MTATDVLRRLPDERGVEHYDGTERTLWGYEQTGEDTEIYRFAASEISGGFLQFDMFRITPAQAIAATLGATDANPTQEESSGTCHDIGTFKSWGLFTCSNCSIVIPLNAAKDAPEVGKSVPLNFCPNCGARVVGSTTNDVDAGDGA